MEAKKRVDFLQKKCLNFAKSPYQTTVYSPISASKLKFSSSKPIWRHGARL
jgi:hypothetical protein